MKYPDCTRYVLMTINYFAIGESLPEAAAKLLKAGAKRSDKAVGSLVLNDPNPTVDSYGGCSFGGADAPDAMLIHLGKLGKVGDLTA
jgi:hypothetical protein